MNSSPLIHSVIGLSIGLLMSLSQCPQLESELLESKRCKLLNGSGAFAPHNRVLEVFDPAKALSLCRPHLTFETSITLHLTCNITAQVIHLVAYCSLINCSDVDDLY